jgi:hypothetical protein
LPVYPDPGLKQFAATAEGKSEIYETTDSPDQR